MTTTPIIDPEFRDFLRPLEPHELDALRQSIQAEGVREPLVVWEETGILLDGHNRLSVCREIGVRFEVVSVSCADRNDALLWIVVNQLDRASQRQVTAREYRYLVGKRYELERSTPGVDTGSGETAVKIAASAGLAPRTVEYAAAITRAVDTIDQHAAGFRHALMRSDVRATAKQLQELAAVAAIEGEIESLDAAREWLREAAEEREYRKGSEPGVVFFQRSVVRRVTDVDIDTGEAVVTAWVLSCGHTVPTKRHVPATTKTKTMPCPECGSGTRTPWERHRSGEAERAAFNAAWGDPARADAAYALMRCAVLALTLSPMDRRQESIREEGLAAAAALGLVAAGRSGAA